MPADVGSAAWPPTALRGNRSNRVSLDTEARGDHLPVSALCEFKVSHGPPDEHRIYHLIAVVALASLGDHMIRSVFACSEIGSAASADLTRCILSFRARPCHVQ